VEGSFIPPAPARSSWLVQRVQMIRCIQHNRIAAIDFAHRQSRHLVLIVATTGHTRCLKGTEK
jgi:hypothetical protein